MRDFAFLLYGLLFFISIKYFCNQILRCWKIIYKYKHIVRNKSIGLSLSWGFCLVPQATHSLNFGGHGTEKVIWDFPAFINSPAGLLLVSHLHQQVLNLSPEFCLPLLFPPYPQSLFSSIYPAIPILHSSLPTFLLKFSLHISFTQNFPTSSTQVNLLSNCQEVCKWVDHTWRSTWPW